MIDWRQGGWTGSLNTWVRREVDQHLRESPVARAVRYSLPHRALRAFFSIRTFARFVAIYLVIDLLAVAAEFVAARLPTSCLLAWPTPSPQQTDQVATLLTNVAGYLISAQVGVLGVISIAIALVTLIAQREGSSTDVQIYYHESLAFELVVSCIALLAVLCAQLVWPLQFLLIQLGGTELQVFKLFLLATHIGWLLMNLVALAHFVVTTFVFVQRAPRERFREQYTANIVQRSAMTSRLREWLYSMAGRGIVGSTDNVADEVADAPRFAFGFASENRGLVEFESRFLRPRALCDVRVIWMRWALRRWAARCQAEAAQRIRKPCRGLGLDRPHLDVILRLDEPLHGTVGWCRREGGVPLDLIERSALRLAFRFKRPKDEREIPSPEQILEELADKAALQINRLAPVAFDDAFDEMTRYHRFLLDLNASRTPDGAPCNYAEIQGDSWNLPHRKWIQQYGRLFERAAGRIPDDGKFLRELAYVSIRLLPGPGDPEFSPGVVCAIVDLGPILMHHLEAWVTKRTTIETPPGEAASPRLSLAGSDASAYQNAVTGVTGAWEHLLDLCPILYGWRDGHAAGDRERWHALRASWPFLLRHLQNTAYSVAIAAWNEDETGASLFRDSSIRWLNSVSLSLDEYHWMRPPHLAFPDILNLDWEAALASVGPLLHDNAPVPTPDQLFNSILRSTYEDVILLTAALLLFWTIKEKQLSDIGGKTSAALLRRELADPQERLVGHGGASFSFGSLFLGLVRLELAGDRFHGRTYGVNLDSLVSRLDGMTERRVVPGRIYTPSTVHQRDELLPAMLAMLMATVPESGGSEALRDRIEELAREENFLPEGDHSLRAILRWLQRCSGALENPSRELTRGFEMLKPGGDAGSAAEALRRFVESVVACIEKERLKRLEALSVDPVKMERLRTVIEDAILKSPAEVAFFRPESVGTMACQGAGRLLDIPFNGIAKAQLVEPAMEEPSSNFEEVLTNLAGTVAGGYIWREFCGRERKVVTVAAQVDEDAFWHEVRRLADQVGSNPVLVASSQTAMRIAQRYLCRGATEGSALKVDRKVAENMGARYIVTLEGVDVYGFDSCPGIACLFSANALKAIHYSGVDENGRLLTLVFELGENQKGTLRASFRQNAVWEDTPAFELHSPASNDT